MKKLLAAIGLLASVLTIGSVIYNAQASAVPAIQALFETSLQASITTNATSATLVSGADLAGNLLNGYYCFTVDAGTTQNEFMCGNASGTALTNLVRGVNPALGISSNVALEFAHRRGADVKITDAPYLSIYSSIFNGSTTIPSIISYDPVLLTNGTTTIQGNPYAIPYWGFLQNYINAVATSGAPDATQSLKGIVQIATPAQIASGTATSTDGSQTLWNVIPVGGLNRYLNVSPVATNTVTITYTASSSWLAPVGATSANVTIYSDSNENSGLGTNGTVVSGKVTVVPGTTYYIGYCSGGTSPAGSQFMGGRTMYFSPSSSYGTSTVWLIAGAGGTDGANAVGGVGGNATGSPAAALAGTTPAQGGTQLAAGAGAVATFAGSSGSSSGCSGGNAFATSTVGFQAGGGGAGFFGGGGGGASTTAAYSGGGGGSSFILATSTITSTSTSLNSGTVNTNLILSYTQTPTGVSSEGNVALPSTNNGTTYTATSSITYSSPFLTGVSTDVNYIGATGAYVVTSSISGATFSTPSGGVTGGELSWQSFGY